MNTIRLSVFTAVQPIGKVYVAKIDAQELLKMSSVDRRHIDNDEEVIGIQRPLRTDKVREIKKYLTTQNATFPNSIIVNVKEKDVVEMSDTSLVIREGEDVFTIIDGQHRLYGFEDYTGSKFELILTIFIGLEVSLQSEVFSVINSQQTKVDPSLNVNLELADKTENPRKKLVQIAQSFNIDADSPWYHQIKMLANQGDGFISLSSFAKPLFNLTYPERLWIEIKNRLNDEYPQFPFLDDLDVDKKRYPFWQFYCDQMPSAIYKILFNYFKALSLILEKDWMNTDSILNKTSGYNALIKLFGDIVKIGMDKGELTEKFFLEILSPLSHMQGTIRSDVYGSSGLYSSNNLYKDMLKEIGLVKS